MSALSDERAAIVGQPGSGNPTVYTLGPTQRFRVEVLTFTLTASSTAGTRNVVVSYYEQDGTQIAAIPDLTDVPASATIVYTFGINLEAFCGVATSGTFVQNVLPDTWLEPGASIVVSSRDASSGAVFSGDRFSAVLLWGIPDTPGDAPDVVPQLTPLASAQEAA